VVHKDGTKLSDVGGVVRQVRAEQLASEYGANDPRSLAENRAIADTYYGAAPAQAGLTTAPLGTAAATTARAGSQIPEPSGLLKSALAGPNPLAQVNSLEREGNVAPGTSAQVADMLAQAPAPATTAPAASSAAGTAPPSVAPGAAVAPAAAPTKKTIRTANGYTYEAEVKPGQTGLTFTVVSGPGVDKMKDKVIGPGDARYKQFTQQLAGDIQQGPEWQKAPAAATSVSELPGARTLPAVRGAEVKPTTLPVTADTQAKVQLLGAPSEVEGRGEGTELEERGGVLVEPTTRTRPTLASAIVGGLGGALREDAAGKEEPGLLGALKARREAKREEERAKMQGEARAEAERQGERFEKQLATTERSKVSQAPAAVQLATGVGMRDIAERERAGAITTAQADAERQKLMFLGAKAAPSAATPAPAPKPATPPPAPAPAAAPTAPAAPAAPVERPDMEAFPPRKSMAQQVAGTSIGKPTAEPPGPKAPGTKPTAVEADKLELARRALSKGNAPTGEKPEPSMAQQVAGTGIGTVMGGQPSRPRPFQRPMRAPEQAASFEVETSGRGRPEPLGEKAEGAIGQAQPATAPTSGTPKRAAKLDLRSRPDAGLTEEESGYKTGQVIRKATGKPLEAYRSLSQDFQPMRPVNAPTSEMQEYTRNSREYANRQK
jgi:hypothetical protein